LELRDLPDPVPADDQLLIEVRATTVTTGDWRVRSLTVPRGFGLICRAVFGLRGPRQPVLGSECAGVVRSVGSKVDSFKSGDEVVVFDGRRMGAHAELKCVRADRAVVLKPASLTFEQAASLPFGGTTAIDFLRRAKLSAGMRVLVNGASGSVGSAMVQLAAMQGAHVTAVCSGANVAFVRSLGAHEVVDYTRDDFAQPGRTTFDLIVDTVGNSPFRRCKRVLKPDGKLLAVLAPASTLIMSVWVSLTSRRRILAGPAGERAADLQQLVTLADEGKYQPTIERVFAFEDLPNAYRHVETGRKRGNIVVRVS
jgi:NADPH:quinone reductase-like Zn-dependent oxidoreductase